MRTTITLDDDLYDDLNREAQRAGQSFREVVNTALRTALIQRRRAQPMPRFVVTPHAMGLREGLSYDDVAGLIEQLEGPAAK